MHKKTLIAVAILFFVFLSGFYYFLPFESRESNTVLLTVSTFLFSLFISFFITRQGKRYSVIRDRLTSFDGIITSVYRNFQYFPSTTAKERLVNTIKDYYETIIHHDTWDFVFTQKDLTIVRNMYDVVGEAVGDRTLTDLEDAALTRTLASLMEANKLRKNVVALREEVIPFAQWVLIYILSFILLVAMSMTIDSHLFLLGAILKGAFATAVVFVVILIKQLDTLKLFEETMGEHSARDVLATLHEDGRYVHEHGE